MEVEQILEKLNSRYKNSYIWEITKDKQNIVGFVDDGTFKNIIAVIEPNENEMNLCIEHIDSHK